jgi:hypothetical protein
MREVFLMTVYAVGKRDRKEVYRKAKERAGDVV